MYALWFRMLLFDAALGAETKTLIFPKTFQPQTVGRKKRHLEKMNYVINGFNLECLA